MVAARQGSRTSAFGASASAAASSSGVGERDASRPAFYALASGGWRDYVTLLHVPYTLWHLSYVVIGAALAPEWLPDRLVVALVAFFLALGIGAHALDELHGRPLATRIPARVLWALAVVSIGAAVAIGIVAALAWTLWLLALVAFGGFIVVAYNLELFGGAFHSDAWFAVGWGALPVLAAYLAAAETTLVGRRGGGGLRRGAELRAAVPVDARAAAAAGGRAGVRHIRARRRPRACDHARALLTQPSERALRGDDGGDDRDLGRARAYPRLTTMEPCGGARNRTRLSRKSERGWRASSTTSTRSERQS